MELIELVCQADSPERFRLVFSRIVDDSYVASRRADFTVKVLIIGFHAALDEVVVDILDALKLVLFVASWSIAISSALA